MAVAPPSPDWPRPHGTSAAVIRALPEATARGVEERAIIQRMGVAPSPLTPFVGRHAERSLLRDLVRDHRLVTATGPGGVGKTRLALAVAGDLADGSPNDAVVVVDLVAITDDALVVRPSPTRPVCRNGPGPPATSRSRMHGATTRACWCSTTASTSSPVCGRA